MPAPKIHIQERHLIIIQTFFRRTTSNKKTDSILSDHLSGATYPPTLHFDSNSIPSKVSTSANSGAIAATPATRLSMMASQTKISNLSVAGTWRTQAMEISKWFAYGSVVFPSSTSNRVVKR